VIRRFEQLTNRLALGILAAAFINSLAGLVSVYHPPGWEQGSGVICASGLTVAIGLGTYLVWTGLRSGRV
jgi:hypothetical protein